MSDENRVTEILPGEDDERFLIRIAGNDILAGIDKNIVAELSGKPLPKSQLELEEEKAEADIEKTRCPACLTKGHLQFTSTCVGHGEYDQRVHCTRKDIMFRSGMTKKEALEKIPILFRLT